MSYEIQFLYKPEKPVSFGTLSISMYNRDFNEILSARDRAVIDTVWKNVQRERGEAVYSKPGSLGTLYNCHGGMLVYRPTDFKTRLAIGLTFSKRTLSASVYEQMRVSCVNAVVRLADGSVFVHRRSSLVTHVPNMLDASVGGFADVNEQGILDFEGALYEKLRRELKISDEEVGSAMLASVHSSREPDFSGMCDFVVDTNLSVNDLERRIDRSYFAEYFVVSSDELPQFIIDHYLHRGDMAPEGCATLLSSLEYHMFLEAVDHLTAAGANIRFGHIKNGIFIPRQTL